MVFTHPKFEKEIELPSDHRARFPYVAKRAVNEPFTEFGMHTVYKDIAYGTSPSILKDYMKSIGIQEEKSLLDGGYVIEKRKG